MNRNTLLKNLREHHEWLKEEARPVCGYGGVTEVLVANARDDAWKEALVEFERTFGSILGIKKN